MELIYIIKVSGRYEKRKLIIPKNSDRSFFQSLLLVIEEQLEIIKQDILSFFPYKKTNISCPKHKDWETQQKVNKIVKIRKINLIIVDKIKRLLEEGEFIICECKGKMYKTPINVPFEKYGTGFLFPDGKISNIKYSYICENCVRAMNEECYLQLKNNLSLRTKLLQQGYNFVPNEYGFWHWIGNKPLNKPPQVNDKEPRYTYDRIIEYEDSNKVKVYDKCRETGKIINIIFK